MTDKQTYHALYRMFGNEDFDFMSTVVSYELINACEMVQDIGPYDTEEENQQLLKALEIVFNYFATPQQRKEFYGAEVN